jgi:nucleotide-binding universal stress UspA family protein
VPADEPAVTADARCIVPPIAVAPAKTKTGFMVQTLRTAIDRLLFVADAAVADVDELPPAVRSVIDAAADVYVVTPTLPGRLAWLADDVDRFRHLADERLDAVLGHMRSIDVDVRGMAIRGSVVTVVADAVAKFRPDHILIALRSSEHANWQERKLISHIEERFALPLTTYAVDLGGHTSAADGPLILCYDGSIDARNAIRRAGALFAGRRALVVTVWEPPTLPGSLGFAGESAGMFNLVELNRAAADEGSRLADEGVCIAQEVDLRAEPVAIESAGPVWKSIVDLADRDDAATIVMGSRGLTGLRALLLGSVSSAVVHHADRPTLIVRQLVARADLTL